MNLVNWLWIQYPNVKGHFVLEPMEQNLGRGSCTYRANAFLQYLFQVEGYDVISSRHEHVYDDMVNVRRIFSYLRIHD